MKNAIVVASLFLVLAAVSCKKDDEKATSFELLTSSTWKIDTAGFDMDKNGEIDSPIPGGFEACDLDNTLTFSSDSTGVFDEGALKCDSSDVQNVPFTWSLSSDEKVLTITGNIPGELDGEIDILTLNETTLKLSKEISSDFPVPFEANLIISLMK